MSFIQWTCPGQYFYAQTFLFSHTGLWLLLMFLLFLDSAENPSRFLCISYPMLSALFVLFFPFFIYYLSSRRLFIITNYYLLLGWQALSADEKRQKVQPRFMRLPSWDYAGMHGQLPSGHQIKRHWIFFRGSGETYMG